MWLEPRLESGTPPRHPCDPTAEDALGERLAVGRGRDRDARVGMQVVDVGMLDEPVHGGVD